MFVIFGFLLLHSSMESDERKRTSGCMEEMKKEKYNENLNVFISFLGFVRFVLVRLFKHFPSVKSHDDCSGHEVPQRHLFT